MATLVLAHKPCNLDYCSSGFGTRHINVSGASTQHKGFDIPGSGGCYAMQKGKVQEVGWNNARGWYIVIKHNSVFSTEYQHLASKPKFKKGASIKVGQRIGTIGSTGVGSRHLHIEIRKNGKPINPQPYLIKAFTPTKITHTLQRITGYNLKALAWRYYLEVAYLQKVLKANNFYSGNIDGKFEAKTYYAVKKLQKKYKLTQDGICGKKTRTVVNKLPNKTKANTKILNINQYYKFNKKMIVRQSYSKNSKAVGTIKKNKKVKATKRCYKYNGRYRWVYCPTLKGWVCSKWKNKVYGKRV